jgi:6-phospho-3-hexuloisomerase
VPAAQSLQAMMKGMVINMDVKKKYEDMYQTVISEHQKVFELLDMDQLKAFMEAIIKANKIFIMAGGREGISLRSFAMRLAHLGKETHWIWDDTTPAMGEGDLFIVSMGSGDVGMFRYIIDQASKTGAKLCMITGLPEGKLVEKYADLYLFIHSAVYFSEGAYDPERPQHDVVKTMQPMGNLYEQHLYMLLDIIVILLKDEMGLTYDDMEKRHRNIE